jgi:menaquinone-dependent protoporphyrinogen oxidase
MRVLIAYASKHGATREIAERVGRVLQAQGCESEVVDVTTVGTLAPYDAVVICSAVYYGHWMKAAAEFVRAHLGHLATSPVWLCSSGALGDKPLPEATEVAEFEDSIHPREAMTFGGALDPAHLGLAERIVVKGVHAQYGDFRDWAAIDAWASRIAEQLSARAVTTGLLA